MSFHTPAHKQVSGWLRAIDEALVASHLDVADASDTYEVAKEKLNRLLAHEQSIGEYFAQQAAPAGWQLVPTKETPKMKAACIKATKGWWDSRAWPAMLAAALDAPQKDATAQTAKSDSNLPSAS